MRHRARRPVLDLLRPLAAMPRRVVLVVAVLASVAATGMVLVGGDGSDSRTAAPTLTDQPRPSYQVPTPTLTQSDDRKRRDRPSARSTDTATADAAAPARNGPEPSRSARRLPVATTPSVDTSAPEPGRVAVDAPQTTATTRTARAGRWTVSVGADEQATYECSLDGGAYAACGNTVTYRDLEAGPHAFAARATDPDGNTDPSPAELTAEVTAPGGR